jgi:hypothetical protein
VTPDSHSTHGPADRRLHRGLYRGQRLTRWESERGRNDGLGRDARKHVGAACADMRDEKICRPADRLFQRGMMDCRTAAGIQRLQGAIDHPELVDWIDGAMSKSGVTDLVGVGCAALDGDAELEQPGCECLDLAHADTGLGRVEIDSGVGPQTTMQERRDTARMPFAGRAGQNDVSQRLLPLGQDSRQTLDQDGDARQIISHTPAIEAAVVDGACEGVTLPRLRPRYRLAIRMGEEDKTAASSLALVGGNDVRALTGIDGQRTGELRHHWHLIRPVAYRLDGTAEPARGDGDDLLDGGFAAALGTDQFLQESQGIAHQIATLACRRRSRRIRLKVV